MIVAERKPKIETHRYEDFDVKFPDGRLTESAHGRVFRLREAITESKRLGRTLTEAELQEFTL